MLLGRKFAWGVGLLVVLGAWGLFVVLVFGVKQVAFFEPARNTYWATFDEVAGLYPKAPVRVAGVTVGHAGEIVLDPKSYRANVSLMVDRSVPIPTDSVIKIYTEGVLGAKYLAILPGYEEQVLVDGDRFKQSESSVILEGLISELVSVFVSKEKVE